MQPPTRPVRVRDKFHKKKMTYDQKFMSEEDQPLTKRRLTLAYHPCNMSRGLMQSALPREVAPQSAQEGEDLARVAAVPNTHRGKYLLERRLPKVVP